MPLRKDQTSHIFLLSMTDSYVTLNYSLLVQLLSFLLLPTCLILSHPQISILRPIFVVVEANGPFNFFKPSFSPHPKLCSIIDSSDLRVIVCRQWLGVERQSRHRLSLDAQFNLLSMIPTLFSRFNSIQ